MPIETDHTIGLCEEAGDYLARLLRGVTDKGVEDGRRIDAQEALGRFGAARVQAQAGKDTTVKTTTFDRLTRRAAVKGGIGALAAVAGVVGANRALAARGGVPKVELCHFDDEAGKYKLITIGEPAVEHHLANHEGDHLAADACGECGVFCDADAGEVCVDGECVVP